MNTSTQMEHVDCRIEPNAMWERYIICMILGEGSFGQVVMAYDYQQDLYVAIKIIKDNVRAMDEAIKEVEILEFINKSDPENQFNIIQLKRYFRWCNRLCLVFELLYKSFDALLKTRGGCSLPTVNIFAHQLCKALYFLRSPHLQIIHCDIKPANILLCDENGTSIQLADFGCSCQEAGMLTNTIQTLKYRAPEVLLGIPYDSAVDMWSLGCTLVELHTNQRLFDGCNELCQMNKIVEILGYPPDSLLKQGSKTHYFFDYIDGIFLLKTPENHACVRPESRKLCDILDIGYSKYKMFLGHSCADYSKFISLLLKMLDYDPTTRITPCKALEHSFFKSYIRARTDDLFNPFA